MKIGIVTSSEIVAIYERLSHKKFRIINIGRYQIFEYNLGCNLFLDIIRAGNGNINSAIATQILIDNFHPDCIAHYGFALALDEKFIGRNYLVDDVIHYDYNATIVGEYSGDWTPLISVDGRNIDWSDAPRHPSSSVCLSGDTLLRTKEQYDYVSSIHRQAEIADMSSAGVAIACHNSKVPCLIIKYAGDIHMFCGEDEYESAYRSNASACFNCLMDIIYWLFI